MNEKKAKEIMHIGNDITDIRGKSLSFELAEQKHHERVDRVEQFISSKGYDVQCAAAHNGLPVLLAKLGSALLDEFEALHEKIELLEIEVEENKRQVDEWKNGY